MATHITMPAIVADATDAIVASWLVELGSQVEVGTPLADIETEKATVELTAEISGRVARLLVEAGSQVAVGSPIVIIADEGDSKEDIESFVARHTARSSGKADPEMPARRETVGNVEGLSGEEGKSTSERIFASPLARRLAKENGIALYSLTGNGPNGRILRTDVEAAIKSKGGLQGATEASSQTTKATQLEPPANTVPTDSDAALHAMSRMRKAIARRLTESKTQVPHFYLSIDVHMDHFLAMRQQVNASSSQKITVNDFIVRAIALALQQVPEAHVAYAGDSIAHFVDADISVAIATEGGLVTPVVRAAQAQSISQVSATIADFAERAQENKIRPTEIAGGTFTVSNLGMYGTKEFSAILNPPQSGILAVGASEKRAVVVDDELAIATVMTCTLSADHRVVDGAVAARLMAKFKELMENPIRTLL